MSSSSSSQDSSEHFHLHYSEFDDRNIQIRGRTLFVIIIIISILFLISLLLLYARWIFKFQAFLPTAASPTHEPPQGLDVAKINSFPVIVHRSAGGVKESECCICLGVFEEGEKMKVLPNCRHFFHSECVDKWLFAHSSCPLCRSPLQV
ncbi:RING-H2 finger protein ATL66 [Impatiens glandulifera]|uniref:RING-H2 finger protein ATL66 n=1 Tax=Impatiens glandulifera TaxID=253017 RepID=UPI001FB0DC17|nr:RING-H2 finger protein ATL66 [Impatiens glandulifera]